jgi:cell filamentation protein
MQRIFAELVRENSLRGLEAKSFASRAAHILAELNAIHPFREGNGRTQNVFLLLLAEHAGHPLDFRLLDPPQMMKAMVASFNGDEEPLANLILGLMPGR